MRESFNSNETDYIPIAAMLLLCQRLYKLINLLLLSYEVGLLRYSGYSVLC